MRGNVYTLAYCHADGILVAIRMHLLNANGNFFGHAYDATPA